MVPGGDPPIKEPNSAVGSPISDLREVDLGPLDLDRSPVKEGPAKRVEKTRATLAYLLFALLATIVLTLLALLAAHKITTDELGSTAGVLISPVIGLLGAATGYYYGKGER